MAGRHRKTSDHLASLTKAELLDLRLCDLKLQIPDSPLAPRIESLYRNLAAKRLRFRPHFWLSDDWFCPDGIPGIAILHE